ncbi:MAG: chemotaxis protein CheW [Rhodanobacteraceae bacterium]|nr:MAG: chemotaxis protein CheW [Rhodanobacteraceae bacterium]
MSKRHGNRGAGNAVDRAPERGSVAVPADVAAASAEQPAGAYALLANYERRSLAHDPGVPEQIEAPGLWRAIGFRVGEHHFVSGIDEIGEILMSPPPVTSIPATRPWLLGVANVRGNLVALVDLKQFLFGQRTHITGRARVLVVKQAGGNVGLLVDELTGQRNLTDADRANAEGEADPGLARFVTENVTLGATRLGRFSMVELAHAAEFQHAGV